MQTSPFQNETECAWWQTSFKDRKILNCNQGFGIAIHSVEVRWSVVAPINIDHDAKELADAWQEVLNINVGY